MRIRELTGTSLTDLLAHTPGGVTLSWLGQAGWLVRTAAATILIDPYLSDALAHKYRGTVYPHIRLHPAPIAPGRLGDIDLVLCSHRHTDHMDPDTLVETAAASPQATFVVPAAWAVHAGQIVPDGGRIVAASEGQQLRFGPVTVDPILAAHESIERDRSGRSLFLGYAITVADVRIYHSGDCVPYDGLAEAVRRLGIDIAILPVNGRSATRLRRGVPGNFHPEEAIALAQASGARILIASHFGLFDFNTLDQPRMDAALASLGPGLTFLQPVPGRSYEVISDMIDSTGDQRKRDDDG